VTCDCGLAVEDPFHKGWHNITSWNQYIFEQHRKKLEDLFDKTYQAELHPKTGGKVEEIPF
jgi:hypothetical protein